QEDAGRSRVLDYAGLKAARWTETYRWTDREVMLYALSIGAGADPMDLAELPFVYENRNLRVLPTFPVVLLRMGSFEQYGIDFSWIVHGEERMTFLRPLPPTGELRFETRVQEVYDKGKDRGALLCFETQGILTETNEHAFTILNVIFARANGGFGGPKGGP